MEQVLKRRDVEEALLKKARALYKDIRPCSHKSSLNDCFTYLPDKVVLWFNIEDDTTKVLVEKF
jgi:hypothetical protein